MNFSIIDVTLCQTTIAEKKQPLSKHEMIEIVMLIESDYVYEYFSFFCADVEFCVDFDCSVLIFRIIDILITIKWFFFGFVEWIRIYLEGNETDCVLMRISFWLKFYCLGGRAGCELSENRLNQASEGN